MGVRTGGQGLYEVTGEIAAWVAEKKISDGLLTVFIRHTSASLIIQENADLAVRRNLETFYRNIAPENPSLSATQAKNRTTCRLIFEAL